MQKSSETDLTIAIAGFLGGQGTNMPICRIDKIDAITKKLHYSEALTVKVDKPLWYHRQTARGILALLGIPRFPHEDVLPRFILGCESRQHSPAKYFIATYNETARSIENPYFPEPGTTIFNFGRSGIVIPIDKTTSPLELEIGTNASRIGVADHPALNAILQQMGSMTSRQHVSIKLDFDQATIQDMSSNYTYVVAK